MEIRIERLKVAKFVTESLYKLVRGTKPVEEDQDYGHSFVCWKPVPGFYISETFSSREGHSLTVYTDASFFFASYHDNDDEPSGLVTFTFPSFKFVRYWNNIPRKQWVAFKKFESCVVLMTRYFDISLFWGDAYGWMDYQGKV